MYSIFFSSAPPDGLSSDTESNLPVSHPTPGMQIVDYASMIVRQENFWPLDVECSEELGTSMNVYCSGSRSGNSRSGGKPICWEGY